MADRRITCINKPDHNSTHEAITHVGETTWTKITRQQAVSDIANGTHTYYVENNSGKRASVKIYQDSYLRTSVDSTWTDNLLSLSEC